MVSQRSTRNDGIFGTPPEPIFNMHPSCMSEGLLVDYLQVLAEENVDLTKTADDKMGCFLTLDVIETVFQICDKLKLPISAKFQAVEMFDKFMTAHTRDLYEHVQGVKKSKRRSDWTTIQERVQNQISLRVVSCCQIASKLTSHYKVVSPENVRRLLAELGHRYSRSSILSSEMRILKTVHYRVTILTPLTFVETLLEIMGHNNCDDVKVYHGICVDLLVLVYLRNRQIYDSLYHLATGRKPQSRNDRMKFAAVKSDFMLRSVAVITAASYIINKTLTHKIADSLYKITRIPVNDIIDLATIIIQQVEE